MGNISIMQKEKPEEQIEKASQEEVNVHSDKKDEKEEDLKKDVPLEKMTKADLLEKIKEVQKQAERVNCSTDDCLDGDKKKGLALSPFLQGMLGWCSYFDSTIFPVALNSPASSR